MPCTVYSLFNLRYIGERFHVADSIFNSKPRNNRSVLGKIECFKVEIVIDIISVLRQWLHCVNECRAKISMKFECKVHSVS